MSENLYMKNQSTPVCFLFNVSKVYDSWLTEVYMIDLFCKNNERLFVIYTKVLHHASG